ncbi:MAG TPA: DUF6249 domain-containing protein [Flavipsychrobacter sp.]|nr:DUF6249 domain-containing protein [Flavipsychrobacter sp.]
MNGGEALVMLVLFICTAGTLFGIWYLRSRENMAMIDKGLNPRQPHSSLPKPFGNLKYGLLLLGGGLGLTIAFIVESMHPLPERRFSDGTLLPANYEGFYFSLLAVGGGLGLVISYMVERKAWERYTNKLQKEKEE